MNHIGYELALLRRDERLREAAGRGLARRRPAARTSAPRITPVLPPRRIRRLARLRPAVRG